MTAAPARRRRRSRTTRSRCRQSIASSGNVRVPSGGVVGSLAVARLTHRMAAGLHRRDDLGLLALLLARELGVLALLRRAPIVFASAIKCIDIAAVVEVADV